MERSPRATVLDRKREREDDQDASNVGNQSVIFFAPSRTLATQRLDISSTATWQQQNTSSEIGSSVVLQPVESTPRPSQIRPFQEPLPPAFRPYEPPVEQKFVRGTTPVDLVRHMMNRTTPDSHLLSKVCLPNFLISFSPPDVSCVLAASRLFANWWRCRHW